MRYLFVVAHPDDEVIGAGATIIKLVRDGNKVAIAIMSGHAAARANLSESLEADESNAMKIMGVSKVYHADFPNIKMNTIPHLDLVQYIESCIVDWRPDAIVTHHPADTNIDHQETSRAVNAACRLFQRTEGIPSLKELMYMEVLSSTEWNVDTSKAPFRPNLFIETGMEGIEKKVEALSAYSGVMRNYPHPRSRQAIIGLAALRGSQAGLNYAEAFELVFCTK